ncbi:inorganic triphosphatase [Affinibrenneria salicis]|uniref:Inorganic triphosphatase n=1 Tax=Affinibrenneria salicis TaxID=2590031 RepID=A0A5J5G7J2_9GAMM|nr:inorganic triphosphatase [Affinibrenneria salicis]KAA9002506.1 inorganic triphosphatase [Affinibrenneria salicis]KAA9003206.1 inorganic triphosphatase [Affinibrenneria salicis]
MSEEIELKFIVHPDRVATLPDWLTDWRSDYSHAERHGSQSLTNIYYETADNLLRRHGIGLRIRGANQRYEMTVKTAGRVVGGLHQHPEYNVELPRDELDLARFPSDIWPPDVDPAALQQALQPLFCTDFVRETWLVTYRQSVIEIAFDRGEVRAGQHSEPICELEMELKLGQADDLLALAAEMAEEDGLRQGSLSKAARGYHLARQTMPRQPYPLDILLVEPKASIDQGIATALESALRYWQYHEELWARGDESARQRLPQASAFMRELLVLIGGVVPRKVTTLFRAALTDLENRLAQPGGADQICYRAGYLQSKLMLASWVIGTGWRDHLEGKARLRLQGSFKRFADIMLGRNLAELKSVFGRRLSADEYLQQQPRLQRAVNAFLILSGAYQDEARPWVAHWQALWQAVAGPQAASPDELEERRKQALAQAPFWPNSGAGH